MSRQEPTHPHWSPALKGVSGLLAIVLGSLSQGLWVPVFQLLLLALLALPMGYGLYVWFNQELTGSDR